MIRIVLLFAALLTLGSAQSSIDQDMDGVPDTLDECKDTPFLDEVNVEGCSVNTLIFPEERQSGSLDIAVGYGVNNDEDAIGRDTQYTSKIQVAYYLDQWNFSFRSGYYSEDESSGMQDTILKVKRKFKLTPFLKVGLGLGVRLPTYDFVGNNTDYTLYSSIRYYPVSALSLFAGANHTFINDEEYETPLKNTTSLYIGSGYFFTKDFYANIAYSQVESKFVSNQDSQSILGALFYKINDKWFTTISYSHQLDDDNLHNALNFKLGYSIW